MAKAAERLLILNDACHGLLCRVHNMYSFKKSDLLNVELDRVIKSLGKRFPDFGADADRITGADVFAKKATEVVAALRDYYLTYADVINFGEECWKFLKDFAKTAVGLHYSTQPEMVSLFLSLISKNVSLHVLANQLEDRVNMLAAYARAHQVTTGNSEPNLNALALYLKKYNEKPLKFLSEDMSELSNCVGEAVSSLHDIILRWSSPKAIQEQKVFNIIDDVKSLSLHKAEDRHLELQNLEEMRNWLLWGYMMCPKELERPGAVEILRMVLKESLILPTFRDRFIPVHERFEKVFKSYKSTTKFKLSNHSKILKDALKDLESTYDHRTAVRHQLRAELQPLVHLFTDFPALLGPKLQLVLAAIRALRDEILWYARHASQPPLASRKKIENDSTLPYLIHVLQSLAQLVRENRAAIRKYYFEYLTGMDATALNASLEVVAKSGAAFNVTKLAQTVQEGLVDRKCEESFEGLRLNCLRLISSINTEGSGVAGRQTVPLCKALTQLYFHSKCVDSLDSLLKTHGSMHNLVWYRPTLVHILQESLSGNASGYECLLSVVMTTSQAVDNLHRMCPEEQSTLGKESCMLADQFLSAIVKAAQDQLALILQQTSALREQASFAAAAQRFGSDQPGGVLPGLESLHNNYNILANLRASKQALAYLCASIQSLESLRVFNLELVPLEYLYDTLAVSLRATIRGIVSKDTRMQYPSAMLQAVKDIIFAFQHVERHVSLNLSELIREVLATELSEDGEVPDEKDSKEAQKHNLLRQISTWYGSLLKRDLAELGIVHSPSVNSFIARPIAAQKGGPPAVFLEAEQYTDPAQLRALVTLVGPGGVRAIEREVNSIIVANVATIKTTMTANQPVLTALVDKFTDQAAFFEAVGKLTDMDTMVKHATVIGCALEFRNSLRAALKSVTDSRVPFLAKAVEVAASAAKPVAAQESKLQPLEQLAADVGVSIAESDHVLYGLLSRFKSQHSDSALWGLLPEAFAVSLTSNRWRSSSYLVGAHGFNSNAHCIAPAVALLINAFRRVTVGPRPGAAEIEQLVQADFERFLRSAAFTVLHVTARLPQDPNIAALPMFLEKIIQASHGRLHMGLLELVLPFTLMRTNVIQLFEKQTASGRVFAVSGDDEKE